MDLSKHFVSPENVETLKLPWGTFQWMNCPAVTGSKKMTAGIGYIEPGQGHVRHNHEGIEEIIYFLQGEGEQMIEAPDGTQEIRTVKAGDMIHLDTSAYHSTINKSNETLVFMAVYELTGPEVGMREDPECEIIPPKNPR